MLRTTCCGRINWHDHLGRESGKGVLLTLSAGAQEEFTDILFVKLDVSQMSIDRHMGTETTGYPLNGMIHNNEMNEPQLHAMVCGDRPGLRVTESSTPERHCMTSFRTERPDESLGLQGRRVATLGDGTEDGGPRRGSGVLPCFHVMHGPGGNHVGGPTGDVPRTRLVPECAHISICRYIERYSNSFNVFQ